MQNFIVLGIIPGTSYQTTFQFWLVIGLGFFGLIGMTYILRRRYAIRAYFAARKINRFLDLHLAQA